MKQFILLITLLFSFQSMAITPIKKDELSKTDGYVITKEEEKKLRTINETKIKLEQLRVVHEQKIEIQGMRLDNYEKYFNESKKLRPLNGWEKIGYYMLGVLASSASLYAASKILKNTK